MPKKKPQLNVTQPKKPDERRTAAYWMQDDNLAVLTGLALQCRSLDELAKLLNVHPVTVRKWRVDHPEIKEAIDIGRDQADAAVIRSTFMDAVMTDGRSRALWWQYRIAPKEEARVRKETEAEYTDSGVVIVDDV